MCSWVVTAPKDLPKNDEQRFFAETYTFLSARYGKDNIISAYVHKDEVTPHMHYAFVPVVPDHKKGGYKVSAKELINRKDLQTFHQDLSAHLFNALGYEAGILNEATREGNKSINELKRKSATERLNETNQKSEQIISEAKDHAKKIVLDAQNSVLKARKEAEEYRDTIAPLQVEYEAKKSFLDQCAKTSDLSMMYPDYAQITRKGLLSKHEYVTVPKEKWEAKHVSADQVSAVRKEREALEQAIAAFKRSPPAQTIRTLQGEIKSLQTANDELQRELDKASKTITRILTVFEKRPDIERAFYDAETAIKEQKQQSRKRHPGFADDPDL